MLVHDTTSKSDVLGPATQARVPPGYGISAVSRSRLPIAAGAIARFRSAGFIESVLDLRSPRFATYLRHPPRLVRDGWRVRPGQDPAGRRTYLLMCRGDASLTQRLIIDRQARCATLVSRWGGWVHSVKVDLDTMQCVANETLDCLDNLGPCAAESAPRA